MIIDATHSHELYPSLSSQNDRRLMPHSLFLASSIARDLYVLSHNHTTPAITSSSSSYPQLQLLYQSFLFSYSPRIIILLSIIYAKYYLAGISLHAPLLYPILTQSIEAFKRYLYYYVQKFVIYLFILLYLFQLHKYSNKIRIRHT
jgi:hypothetical protein